MAAGWHMHTSAIHWTFHLDAVCLVDPGEEGRKQRGSFTSTYRTRSCLASGGVFRRVDRSIMRILHQRRRQSPANSVTTASMLFTRALLNANYQMSLTKTHYEHLWLVWVVLETFQTASRLSSGDLQPRSPFDSCSACSILWMTFGHNLFDCAGHSSLASVRASNGQCDRWLAETGSPGEYGI